MDEIKRYYVTQYNEQVQAEIAALPDVDVPGTGRFLFHPLSTPNVTLAEDGKTAQGTWYSIGRGLLPRPRTEPPIAWNCQKICADFIKEPGGWKIWHVVFSNDFMNKTDTTSASCSPSTSAAPGGTRSTSAHPPSPCWPTIPPTPGATTTRP